MLRSLLTTLGISVVVRASQTTSLAHGGQRIQSTIEWGPCDTSVVNDTSLSCGFLDVPLDYQHHVAGRARLALIKANASGERRGSALFNPGGPGGSGLMQLISNKDSLLSITGGLYDIVSWDPRGVGLTIPGPVFCFDSNDEYLAFFNGTIELSGIEETGNFTDPADIATLFAQADIMQQKYTKVGQKCLRSPSGKFLKYMGTATAVRDLVSIADALDGPDAPINYLGFSYGTLIGSWFINMFPERVGRVILNGVFDPVSFATQEQSTNWAHLISSADDVYKGFVTGCALAGPSGCAVAKSENDTALDIDAAIQSLIAAAYDARKANASSPIGSGEIREQLFDIMYTPADWGTLLNEVYPELVAVLKGELLTKRSLAKRYSYIKGQSSGNDSPTYTSQAVWCGDSIDAHSTNMKDVFKAVVDGSQHESHLFGSLWPSLVSQCSFWPVRSAERYQGPFNKTLANKILIASSTYDPITSLAGAQVLAGQLGDQAALVRSNGFGHTTILSRSACVNEIMFAYMVNGTLPMNNTVCEVDADLQLFEGVTTADILANLPTVDV